MISIAINGDRAKPEVDAGKVMCGFRPRLMNGDPGFNGEKALSENSARLECGVGCEDLGEEAFKRASDDDKQAGCETNANRSSRRPASRAVYGARWSPRRKERIPRGRKNVAFDRGRPIGAFGERFSDEPRCPSDNPRRHPRRASGRWTQTRRGSEFGLRR